MFRTARRSPSAGGRRPGTKNRIKIIDLNNWPNNILSANAGSLINPTPADYVKKFDLEPRRADYEKLVEEIHEDLELVKHTLFRLSERLAMIQRKQWYFLGGYSCFGDFLVAEIGSRSRGYELLHCQEVLGNLLEGGFKMEELPRTEALCREIRKADLKVQAKCWEVVMKKAAEEGREPTAGEVRDALSEMDAEEADAKDEKGAPTEEETKDFQKKLQQQQAKLMSDVKSANSKLRFNLVRETLTDDFRRRLTVELMAIGTRVSALLTVVKFDGEQTAPKGVPMERAEHDKFDAAQEALEEQDASDTKSPSYRARVQGLCLEPAHGAATSSASRFTDPDWQVTRIA